MVEQMYVYKKMRKKKEENFLKLEMSLDMVFHTAHGSDGNANNSST